MGQLMSFLKRNSSIRCLRIADENLRRIPFDTQTIQLDYLNVNILKATDTTDLLSRLKTLNANGFFQKLRLSIKFLPDDFDSELFVQELVSFRALEVLYTIHFYTNASCQLTQLKELHVMYLHNDVNLDAMARNF